MDLANGSGQLGRLRTLIISREQSDDADCHSGVDGDEDLSCQGFKEDTHQLRLRRKPHVSA